MVGGFIDLSIPSPNPPPRPSYQPPPITFVRYGKKAPLLRSQSGGLLSALGLELAVELVARVGAGHVEAVPESAAHGDAQTCAGVVR